jgi:hypothetical protein
MTAPFKVGQRVRHADSGCLGTVTCVDGRCDGIFIGAGQGATWVSGPTRWTVDIEWDLQLPRTVYSDTAFDGLVIDDAASSSGRKIDP